MEMFEYNGNNLDKACQIIANHLSSDLLPKKWIERNSTNPMFGHCHTASACLQRLFGTKNIKLYRALDNEGIWHWWAVTKEGKRIDITADQYYSTGRTPPYEAGEKASMLGFEYRKRVYKLLDIVRNELLSNGTPLV
jgi:hypothetical protein